ncbi:acetyl-CoA carboxylase carboxyl transferase subunit alpha [Candidatus Acetothermia bacterium]|nr:MAG: acetyl-CoA carboxylase carboxyl transferase subunit alpha [Candidatus Acetothermia bacterium]
MSDEQTLDLLEAKIKELRELNKIDGIDLSAEIARLEEKLIALRKELYSNMSEWERVKLARHPDRPYALDYIRMIFEDFYELHGDRLSGDDPAIVAGLARLDGTTVAVIGQQKGRSMEENKLRNFGMPRPQGYRKARRIMRLAERFSFPVITLIDTPGAYPGLAAEENNVGEAIAVNLETMAQLRTPIISAVIGEGGSGGAIAIGLADRILMLENAIYSVISPEGAAAILWKDKERVREAAAALNLTAPRLHELGVIDEVVPEPLGGAHKDPAKTAAALKDAFLRHLGELVELSPDALLKSRYDRYRRIGRYRTLTDR